MRNLNMDERCFKRKVSEEERKQPEKEQRSVHNLREYPDRRSTEYLYPRGECHCDRCVTTRYWDGV